MSEVWRKAEHQWLVTAGSDMYCLPCTPNGWMELETSWPTQNGSYLVIIEKAHGHRFTATARWCGTVFDHPSVVAWQPLPPDDTDIPPNKHSFITGKKARACF